MHDTFVEEDHEMVQLFEDRIPEDATCISFKVNIPDYDPSDNNFSPPAFGSVLRYLKDCGVDIIAYSSGIHLEGRKKVPHIHYHFISNHYNEPSNKPQHLRRWLGKKGNETEAFNNGSFRYQQLDSNKLKFQFLSYPLKEGHLLPSKYYMFDYKPMTKEMKNFLLYVGTTLYATATALRRRQEKCQERKQLAYNELVELVQDKTFSSFRELCDWFDENYLYKLEFEDIPDPKNYKTNIRKIGMKMRLLKTFDLS